jgi:hypothetical protein
MFPSLKFLIINEGVEIAIIKPCRISWPLKLRNTLYVKEDEDIDAMISNCASHQCVTNLNQIRIFK